MKDKEQKCGRTNADLAFDSRTFDSTRGNIGTGRVAIAVAIAMIAGCRPHGPTAAVAAFSPLCGGEADLSYVLADPQHALEQSIERVKLRTTFIESPSAAELQNLLGEARRGWFLFSFTGHGVTNADGTSTGVSQICLGESPEKSEALTVNSLIDALPESLSGAVFVLNACASASVDPRLSPIPISIISAAPFKVMTDAGFVETLAAAMADITDDPNCDGLITDQELFDRLVRGLNAASYTASGPAYPKLRRQADSHIPLPIAPRPSERCRQARQRIEQLLAAHREEWRVFGTALDAQLTLASAVKSGRQSPLPESKTDYFIVDAPADIKDTIIEVVERDDLTLLPGVSAAEARDLSRFITFAEIYLIQHTCGWVRINRLRDGQLMATRKLALIEEALPRRETVLASPILDLESDISEAGLDQLRIIGSVDASRALKPVPCHSMIGQCFRVP